MEKFKHFADAATGIHPFVCVVAPTLLSTVLATCMFPIRLLFCGVFVLLLLVTDALLSLLYVAHLAVVGRALLGPLQRLWLRGLLFSVGHVLPAQQRSIARVPSATQDDRESPMAKARAAGSLSVCNLQSVWDLMVLEVVVGEPYYAVAFPDVSCKSSQWDADGVRVFWPGPLQRWRVWCYIRHTGSLSFVAAQVATDSAVVAKEPLPLALLQDRAGRAGVPLWWFGEGTCSNGRGILTMPELTCRTGGAGGGARRSTDASPSALSTSKAVGCQITVLAIQYDTPALQNVVGDEDESLMQCLRRASVLLYGSASPTWSSPFFPHAEVAVQLVAVTRGVPSPGAPSDRPTWHLNSAAMLEIRSAICQRNRALVVSSSSSGNASQRRQALSVGMREKYGFLQAMRAMTKSGKAQM